VVDRKHRISDLPKMSTTYPSSPFMLSEYVEGIKDASFKEDLGHQPSSAPAGRLVALASLGERG
jgi:hypothetical protein